MQSGIGGSGWQLFSDWSSIGHIVAQAALFYVIMVAALRVAGQRALAKMSAYDMIVTVALGSLVASVATASDITVSDGVAAVVTFLVLQGITSWLQARSRLVHHVVRERPQVMVWNGRFLDDRLREASVSQDEVRAAIRRTGLLSVSQVQCVVLENDGEWSVMGRADVTDLSALEGLALPYDLAPGADPADWRGDPEAGTRKRERADRPAGRDAERGLERHVVRSADSRHHGGPASSGPV